MNEQQFNKNAGVEHIKGLLAELPHYPWGEAFLETLERSEYPVLPMPEEMAKVFTNSPALLNLDPHHTIYLTPEATLDDLCHEIRHVEQYCALPEELLECPDMKHFFILHAFMEADAYAHQAAMFIQMLVDNPQKRVEENEIFWIYNDPKSEILMEPVRVALYLKGQASPDDIVTMMGTDEEALKKMMSFVFSWAFHEIIPNQYEERHLDAVDTALSKNPQTFNYREARIDVLTQADIEFFKKCVQNFGGIITNYEESYLIDDDGMGLDLEVHLAQIITPEAAGELERLNNQIAFGVKPGARPEHPSL